MCTVICQDWQVSTIPAWPGVVQALNWWLRRGRRIWSRPAEVLKRGDAKVFLPNSNATRLSKRGCKCQSRPRLPSQQLRDSAVAGVQLGLRCILALMKFSAWFTIFWKALDSYLTSVEYRECGHFLLRFQLREIWRASSQAGGLSKLRFQHKILCVLRCPPGLFPGSHLPHRWSFCNPLYNPSFTIDWVLPFLTFMDASNYTRALRRSLLVPRRMRRV